MKARNTMTACRLALASAFMIVPVSGWAQTDVSSIGELERVLKQGQTVLVTDSSDRTIKGTFFAVVGDSLVLSTPEERVIPWKEIRRVKRRDPVWNGALIGGAILGTWCAVVCGQGLDQRGQLLPAIAVNAGLGALIGLGIDALSGGNTVYRRNAESTARVRVRPGISVSLRF